MFRRTSARIMSSVAVLLSILGLPPTAAAHFDGSSRSVRARSMARYSYHKPHQGRREIERRRQQVERGVLHTN